MKFSQKTYEPKKRDSYAFLELLYFSGARRSATPVSWLIRPRPKTYTTESARSHRLWFLRDVGQKIKKSAFFKRAPKIDIKKQDFCTDISTKRVLSPRLPSIVSGLARRLHGTNMEAIPSCTRNLRCFYDIPKTTTCFSAFFEIEELLLQAENS